MSCAANGQLVPLGGGDPIPLIRQTLTIGRRESADICWRLPNVSGLHAELFFKEGHWFIKDLDSTNGIKVNGRRVSRRTTKILHPGDTVTIAKRAFTIEYAPPAAQRVSEIIEDLPEEDVFSQSLLERAGLISKPRVPGQRQKRGPRTEFIAISHDD